MLVVNDRVETCLSSPFPAHLKPIVKSVISSGGGNGSYQNQLGLLGCRVEMWKVEVGDFVKYVSQLPSCSDLTNIRNILGESPTPVNLALFKLILSLSKSGHHLSFCPKNRMEYLSHFALHFKRESPVMSRENTMKQ